MIDATARYRAAARRLRITGLWSGYLASVPLRNILHAFPASSVSTAPVQSVVTSIILTILGLTPSLRGTVGGIDIIDPRHGLQNLSFLCQVRTALGPTCRSKYWVTRIVPLELRWPVREANNSPSYTTETETAYTQKFSYIFSLSLQEKNKCPKNNTCPKISPNV